MTSRYSTHSWRSGPSGKSTGCFKGSPCVSTRIETPIGLPVFVLVAFLVSGVLGVGRVVATPTGFGVRPPLIRSPLSPLGLAPSSHLIL